MKIKRCPNPYCNATAKDLRVAGDTVFWVVCNKCKMEGPLNHIKEEAISNWNDLPRRKKKENDSPITNARQRAIKLLKSLLDDIKKDKVDPRNMELSFEKVYDKDDDPCVATSIDTGQRVITIKYYDVRKTVQ
jgi:hypothetical protein